MTLLQNFLKYYYVLFQVIAGEDREAVGQLISIENQEGVVKFGTDDIKIMQLRHLCKMSTA